MYAYDRSLTAKGKAQTPSYSMSSRSTLKNKACNPGTPTCGRLANSAHSLSLLSAPGQYNSVDMGKSSKSKKSPGMTARPACLPGLWLLTPSS